MAETPNYIKMPDGCIFFTGEWVTGTFNGVKPGPAADNIITKASCRNGITLAENCLSVYKKTFGLNWNIVHAKGNLPLITFSRSTIKRKAAIDKKNIDHFL